MGRPDAHGVRCSRRVHITASRQGSCRFLVLRPRSAACSRPTISASRLSFDRRVLAREARRQPRRDGRPIVLEDRAHTIPSFAGNHDDRRRHPLRGTHPAPLAAPDDIGGDVDGAGHRRQGALFTLVDQVLLRTLPAKDARQIVQVSTSGEFYGGSSATCRDLISAESRSPRQRSGVRRHVGAVGLNMRLGVGNESRRVRGEW